MRQIKSFILSVHRLLEIADMKEINPNRFENGFISVQNYKSHLVSIKHLKNRNEIHFSISEEYYTNRCIVHAMILGGYETSEIDLSIEDKVDYFNYTVQNDPGRLTLDDISVLKEIRTNALKILYNEKTIY